MSERQPCIQSSSMSLLHNCLSPLSDSRGDSFGDLQRFFDSEANFSGKPLPEPDPAPDPHPELDLDPGPDLVLVLDLPVMGVVEVGDKFLQSIGEAVPDLASVAESPHPEYTVREPVKGSSDQNIQGEMSEGAILDHDRLFLASCDTFLLRAEPVSSEAECNFFTPLIESVVGHSSDFMGEVEDFPTNLVTSPVSLSAVHSSLPSVDFWSRDGPGVHIVPQCPAPLVCPTMGHPSKANKGPVSKLIKLRSKLAGYLSGLWRLRSEKDQAPVTTNLSRTVHTSDSFALQNQNFLCDLLFGREISQAFRVSSFQGTPLFGIAQNPFHTPPD